MALRGLGVSFSTIIAHPLWEHGDSQKKEKPKGGGPLSTAYFPILGNIFGKYEIAVQVEESGDGCRMAAYCSPICLVPPPPTPRFFGE